MTLDADDLHLLVSIANLRAWLKEHDTVLSEGMNALRVVHAKMELQTMEERWVNHGLEAAGMPHAIDPATLPPPSPFTLRQDFRPGEYRD